MPRSRYAGRIPIKTTRGLMPRAGACGPPLCAGLALRVASSGVKTFSLHYGPSAKRVRMTLGRYPRVTLARARTMALDALARVHVGEDPRRTAAANVADLAAAYLAEYVRPNLRRSRAVPCSRASLWLFDRRSKRKRTVRTTMSRQNRCRRRMRTMWRSG
jgi:hypothetical protein